MDVLNFITQMGNEMLIKVASIDNEVFLSDFYEVIILLIEVMD